jgi:hypothetical protein
MLLRAPAKSMGKSQRVQRIQKVDTQGGCFTGATTASATGGLSTRRPRRSVNRKTTRAPCRSVKCNLEDTHMVHLVLSPISDPYLRYLRNQCSVWVLSRSWECPIATTVVHPRRAVGYIVHASFHICSGTTHSTSYSAVSALGTSNYLHI